MASVTVELPDGRSFEIAPFKFDSLELAAPHIDQLNDLVERSRDEAKAARKRAEDRGDKEPDKKAVPTATTGFALMRVALEIIAIGTSKIDPAMSVDALREMVGIEHLAALQSAALAILAASGLAPKGEEKAPSRPAKGARSKSR